MQEKALTPIKESIIDKPDEQKIKQVNSYIQNRLMPIFGPLQFQLLTKRPHNIKEYCIEWLKKYNHNRNQDPKQLFSDEESEQQFLDRRRKKLKGKRRRKGVSGESTQNFYHLLDEAELKNEEIFWPEQTKVSLMMFFKKCLFFEHLSHDSLLKLISKGKQKLVEKDEVVIQQGESGNSLYIVLEGRFKCEKQGNIQMMKEYKTGEVFGELALLYNTPRATTITSITHGRLFELGRQQFHLILRSKKLKKLQECQKLVDQIQFFKDLDIYQRIKLFQALQEKRVPSDKYIIKQGEIGGVFYIVAQGQLVAYKCKDGDNKLVYAYKKGDYFGQIALLKNVPRQASIKTLTQTRLYQINRESFMKIIGPLQGILSRSCQRYTIWSGELSGQGEF